MQLLALELQGFPFNTARCNRFFNFPFNGAQLGVAGLNIHENYAPNPSITLFGLRVAVKDNVVNRASQESGICGIVLEFRKHRCQLLADFALENRPAFAQGILSNPPLGKPQLDIAD